MARLPIPGGDNFNWGEILNKYLSVEHKDDGTHDVSRMLNVPASEGFVLTSKNNKIVWKELNKDSLGISSIDDTSDLEKPISLATQNALDERVLKSGDRMIGDLVIDGHQDDTTKSLDLTSSIPSDDILGGTDGTSRLNLQSYQRANYNAFGETIRHFLMKKNAKAMEAYYVPKQGYDSDGNPIAGINPDGTISDIAEWQPVSWTGSHFEANNGASNHVHWELEIPDSTGALQGRLEVPFADPNTEQIGLDKTFIRTNLADFVVRTSNNQMLRLASPAGNHKPIEFNHDSEGLSEFRRWVMRANSTAETGGDAGTDFQITRYSDSGAFQDSPLFIKRSSGYIGLGTISTPARISLTSSTTPEGGINFGGDVNLYRSGVDTLKTDDNFEIGKNGSNTTFTKKGNAIGDEFFVGTNGAMRSQRSSGGSEVWRAQINGDSDGRILFTSSGVISWGTGNAAQDTSLYRNGVNSLKTNGKLDAASFAVNGANGASGNFTSIDGKTITVTNGLVTNIV